MSNGAPVQTPTRPGSTTRKTPQEGGGAPPQSGPPAPGGQLTGGGDELDRLSAMLEQIRLALHKLVFLNPPVLPVELRSQFIESWLSADASFQDAIAVLKDDGQRVRLVPLLEAAGFTGVMLRMKETSLNFHLRRLETEILTYESEGKLEKIIRFVKRIRPGLKLMNSIMGSLLRAIPGIEVAKEYKEHVEAGYDVVEASVESASESG